MIDVDSLGNWRDFRRSLGQSFSSSSSVPEIRPATSVSTENEAVLATQNEELALEYRNGVWAHETSVPELGGLMVRMPLEVELYRNHKHCILGKQFRNSLAANQPNTDEEDDDNRRTWRKAHGLIQSQMLQLADKVKPSGELDAAKLSTKQSELLQMYLDHQETWQEVCLIYQKEEASSEATSCMVVLNRPMAMKLTENLAQLILFGNPPVEDDQDEHLNEQEASQLVRFLLAFGSECGVYIGGPDQQDQPALLLHGFAELPGATEIANGLYQGGLEAAMDGVLRGKYRALDFRFFVGRHECESPFSMELLVELGKYQPIAAARSLALKQCLSLPKPLWHEVLELCGGKWKEMSTWERTKKDTIQFQILDDDDEDIEDWGGEIVDELSELELDEDDVDDEFGWL
ncbi:hypothetical protein FisN_24Hh033 [Fistulifera solaris]|uniref:Uncharacterized protein n=1 Tax=Fistulifera solaris TaxID=1519565 RepID=A0A1Z5JER3_FISSO|nr:hypothetical protein FisN_24Hh033 [Fistulifera solaris]|eukprot:GAX12459.1 hypothetical protein FisN_24Hh033 [Fistulifera solaris]